MSLAEKAARAWRLCRDRHYLEAISQLTRYVPGRLFLFRQGYLLVLRTRWITPGRKEDVPVRLAGVADIPRLARLVDRESEHWEAVKQDCAFCVVAELDGNIIGYELCHTRGSHYERTLDYRFELGPRSAWCYDAYVDELYRKRGVWRAVQTGITRHLGESYKFYALVDFANHASLRAHLRCGFRVARCFREIDLLGLRFLSDRPCSQKTYSAIVRRLGVPAVARSAKRIPTHEGPT